MPLPSQAPIFTYASVKWLPTFWKVFKFDHSYFQWHFWFKQYRIWKHQIIVIYFDSNQLLLFAFLKKSHVLSNIQAEGWILPFNEFSDYAFGLLIQAMFLPILNVHTNRFENSHFEIRHFWKPFPLTLLIGIDFIWLTGLLCH